MSLLFLLFLSGLWPGPSRRGTCALSGCSVLIFIVARAQLQVHIILPWEPGQKHHLGPAAEPRTSQTLTS